MPARPKDKDGNRLLTPKEKACVDFFMACNNQTEALRKARGGVKKSNDPFNAWKLFKRPHVAAEVERRQKLLSAKMGITAERVMQELAKVAFFNLTNVAAVKDGHVRVAETADTSPDDQAALAELAESTTGTGGGSLRAKAHDKIKALELLGKHLGLFKDNPEAEDVPLPTVINVNVVDGRRQD